MLKLFKMMAKYFYECQNFTININGPLIYNKKVLNLSKKA